MVKYLSACDIEPRALSICRLFFNKPCCPKYNVSSRTSLYKTIINDSPLTC